MQRIKQIVSVLWSFLCISTLAFSSFSITADDTYADALGYDCP